MMYVIMNPSVNLDSPLLYIVIVMINTQITIMEIIIIFDISIFVDKSLIKSTAIDAMTIAVEIIKRILLIRAIAIYTISAITCVFYV